MIDFFGRRETRLTDLTESRAREDKKLMGCACVCIIYGVVYDLVSVSWCCKNSRVGV